jgi:diaminopimelate epimerase
MSFWSSTFTKFHGNGNDFIIFDLAKQPSDSPQLIIENASRLCHRHLGIGADGLILLTKTNRWHMTIVNADGSIASNCGNGLRVAASYIFRHHEQDGPVSISLNERTFACERFGEEIRVAMGMCRITYADSHPFSQIGGVIKYAYGEMGNEHLLFLVDQEVNDFDGLLDEIQKVIPKDKFNIGFLSRGLNEQIFSHVFERGVGWTKSCGTGAMAAACFWATLYPSHTNPLIISQPGGDLLVEVAVISRAVDLWTFDIVQQGKATEVFTGICQLAKS